MGKSRSGTEQVRAADKTGYGHARRLLCIVQLVAAVSRSPDNTRHDLCVSQGKT